MDNDSFSIIPVNRQLQLKKVMECNDFTNQFGLQITKQEALELIQAKQEALKEQQRVEFGEGILPKLIYAFCDSPFIDQDNYVETLTSLQDIFYLYKNESLDEWSDDELIEYMKHYFDGKCMGSLEYLEETVLQNLSREIRYGIRRDTDDTI